MRGEKMETLQGSLSVMDHSTLKPSLISHGLLQEEAAKTFFCPVSWLKYLLEVGS
jgi:hypothetical protein